MRKKPLFLNQGTSQPKASQEKVNGDMASEWEELVELDDVQLATVVGGYIVNGIRVNDWVVGGRGNRDHEGTWMQIETGWRRGLWVYYPETSF